MESIWFIILITLSICLTLKSLFNYLLLQNKSKSKSNNKLPPGPLNIPILSNLQWLRKSFADLEPILRNLKSTYGPIITLHVGHRKSIFITSPILAHQALIQNGAAFADRPPAPPTSILVSGNQHNISGSSYGPLWRLLRRNLTHQILHPSKIKSFSPARKWVMELLKKKLNSGGGGGGDSTPLRVVDHFQYAMFCLLVFMCFGEKLEDKKIREIESVQRTLLLGFGRFNFLNFFPNLSKILFKNRWRELYKMRRNQEQVLVPIIRSRQQQQQERQEKQQQQREQEEEEKFLVVSYVDTLLNLTLPDEFEGRKLDKHEIVSLCSEFLNAGTDTTSTALQWIMTNLVKHQEIQSKLIDEIKSVVKSDDEIKEEDLQKMPYLKAVVLEGLRRHPPGHFVLPHAVTEDQRLDGYVIPKDATVNFLVAEIGWDPKLWKDPMKFKPERFLSGGEGFDITGSREIKMMPFGVGRRICPGLGLALLHLEYFVANLVWEFEWTARIGDDIDLSEKQEFTMVMKNPLWAHISPRVRVK